MSPNTWGPENQLFALELQNMNLIGRYVSNLNGTSNQISLTLGTYESAVCVRI